MKNHEIDLLKRQYSFSLKYAHKLVADIKEDKMAVCPAPGLENHPAFVLGHLSTGSALVAKYLGGNYEVPEGWDKLFRRNGPGDPRLPTKDANIYPAKELLLGELKRQHMKVENLLEEISYEKWKEPHSWRFARHFPTLGDAIWFLCIAHENMHLAQLAAWRRGLGLPGVLSNL